MIRARWPLLAGVAIGTLVADQLTKAAVQRFLLDERPVVLGPFLSFTLAHNPGGAFGLLPQATVVLAAASALIALALLLYARFALAHSRLLTVGVAMLLGGALGNLTDRVRLGHVIDFIDLHRWPVFNIADIAVTVGAGLIVLAAALPRKKED